MTNNKLITKLLKLSGLKVTDFSFHGRGKDDKELWLTVKPHKNGCRCPECGKRGNIVHVLQDARIWRDVRVCGWNIVFLYCPKEIDCAEHGRIQEEIPWAAPMARITYRLEHLILVHALYMTQVAAASLVGVARSTFSDILHRTIARHRQDRKIRGLTSIGIDEVSYKKGHKYITVVYDLDRRRVIWVGKGKRRETIDKFFKTELSAYQRANIKWACCDMSETFIGAIREHCPNVKLVLDRFHIVKALNEAVDEVRKEQWRKATKEERAALKGLRWIIFRPPSRRSPQDEALLKKVKRGNRRIWRACVLKDEFNLFWDFESEGEARAFLKSWGTSALLSRLEPIRKFVRTLRRHIDSIVTFIERRLTNAVSEGLNRIIGMIRNRASGFRSVDAFIDLIYLTIGDVDILAKYAARFQTT